MTNEERVAQMMAECLVRAEEKYSHRKSMEETIKSSVTRAADFNHRHAEAIVQQREKLRRSDTYK
jgi:hypothetical protein